MIESDIELVTSHEINPEEYCYRDAISELKKRHIVYIYKKIILERVLLRFPNAKVVKNEFYWKVENVED